MRASGSDLPNLPNFDSDREERASVVKLRKSDLVNCRVGSCNHTFVADSFEKRDDFCIARKFSDEFFHLIGHGFFADEL